ncbi:MAG TPA: aldo/keto reductase family protein, partial [Anaerolineae bacterium]
GKWGVKLSVIGVGSYLTYGYKVGDDVAKDCLRYAFDHGVNFFDTANVYNRGGAEQALGRLLADLPRESFVLATKVWGAMGEGPNDQGLSRKHIFEQCHASLRRLKMDYIDLYQCHRYDPTTPLEETIRAVNDLCRQGKILYWGVSEWSAAQIAQANGLCRQSGFQPMSSNQPRYNLFWRHPEREVFPLCEREGIGQVVFSPLAHGLLTGKYVPGNPPSEGTRASDPDLNEVILSLYWKEENLLKAKQLTEIARDLSVTAAQLSLAWCLRQSIVSSAITSATKVSQLEDNLKATEVTLPDHVLTQLDGIFSLPSEI